MRNKYSHDIEKLWQRFKTKEADPTLYRFDATIHALHGFEDLRYPDKIPHSEILMAITWHPSHAVQSHTPKPTPQYEVFISEVDGLVIEILKRVRLNPKFFIDEGWAQRTRGTAVPEPARPTLAASDYLMAAGRIRKPTE